MRIQETAVAVNDIAAYGEELTDAELAEVNGGFVITSNIHVGSKGLVWNETGEVGSLG